MVNEMNLYEKIKDDRNRSRGSDRVKYETLTLLLGEIDNITKRESSNPDNDMITKIITKIVKSCKETYALRESERLLDEIGVLQAYLPKQMSEDEIRNHVIASGVTSIPDAHKMMKGGYQGQYDPALLNQILKQMF